jgi:hypothetical protein
MFKVTSVGGIDFNHRLKPVTGGLGFFGHKIGLGHAMITILADLRKTVVHFVTQVGQVLIWQYVMNQFSDDNIGKINGTE